MTRNWRRALGLGMVLAVVLMAVSPAEARWGGSWGSGSSGGGWGSSSSGNWGSHSSGGRLRRARWRSHSSGSWGSHSSGRWGSSSSSSGGGYSAPAPAYEEARADSTINFAVRLPADAKVVVNGATMTNTGSYRRYITRDLTPGKTYKYEVMAQHTVNGQIVEQKKTIDLTPGRSAELTFDFDADNVSRLAARRDK